MTTQRWKILGAVVLALSVAVALLRVEQVASAENRQRHKTEATVCRVQATVRDGLVDLVNRLTAPRLLGSGATPPQIQFQADQNSEAAQYRAQVFSKLAALNCGKLSASGNPIPILLPPPPLPAVGAVGPSGERGTIGLTGLAGPPGPPGKDGAFGLTGAVGMTGAGGAGGSGGTNGSPGANGTNGTNGANGATGPTGPPGPAGPAGPPGPQGPAGPPGCTPVPPAKTCP